MQTLRPLVQAACLAIGVAYLGPQAAIAVPFDCDDVAAGSCCIDNGDGSKTRIDCGQYTYLNALTCNNLVGGTQCGWNTGQSAYQCSVDNAEAPGGNPARECPGTLAEFTGCDTCQESGRFCGVDACGSPDSCGTCATGWTCDNAIGVCQNDTTFEKRTLCCDGDVLWETKEVGNAVYAPGVAVNCKSLLGPSAACTAIGCVKHSAPRGDGHTTSTWSSGYKGDEDDKAPWCPHNPSWTAPDGSKPSSVCQPDCDFKQGGAADGCGGTCPALPSGHCGLTTSGSPFGSDECNSGCGPEEWACPEGGEIYCIDTRDWCNGQWDCDAPDDEAPGCTPGVPPPDVMPKPAYCDWGTGDCIHASQCLPLGYRCYRPGYGPSGQGCDISSNDWKGPYLGAVQNLAFADWNGGSPSAGLLRADECYNGFCPNGVWWNIVPCGTSANSRDPTQDCGNCADYRTAANGTGACSSQVYGPAQVKICLCAPDCNGRSCGDDGCGGTCGTCSAGTCDADTGVCQCTPSCDGTSCGVSDGCGGVCGCGAGQVCNNPQGTGGTCCAPSCSGKECGSDGCGGTCGDCQGTFNGQGNCDTASGMCVCDGTGVCSSKQCGTDGCGNACSQQCPPFTPCNDAAGACGQCQSQCSIQGWECGDDGCGGTCGAATPDGCGPGLVCNTTTHQCECLPDCTGKTCGDDGCGGSCGSCGANPCINDNCCTPNCSGRVCGDDGCGGSCGTCSGTQDFCTGAGLCQCQPNCQGKACGDDGCGGSCGDCSTQFGGLGVCSTNQCVCQPDCTGKACGDGGCVDQPNACGTCAGGPCINDQCCSPDCSGKQCGDDGCGGSCGTCGTGTGCDTGTGQCTCIPDCSGKACGDDGCGGSCGTCTGPGEGCNASNQCECTASCNNMECGGGLCAQQCGNTNCAQVLGNQYSCNTGQCVCTPDCTGKTCGNDGCGGSCGSCGPDEACVSDTCACVPQCLNADNSARECGDDQCGSTCGTCAADQICNDGTCYPDDLGCTGKTCGPNLLGAPDGCGTCEAGEFCHGPTSTCRVSSCPSMPSDGCCQGNLLKTCDNGSPLLLDCSSISGFCGWDAANGTYDCLDSPSASVGPTPQQCGGVTCTPDCTGKACGDDGCGGTCGSCNGQNAYCDFASGTCKINPCSDVPDVGCCQGATLVTCDATTQQATSTFCPSQGAGTCGWSASAGAYACGTLGTEEPSGTHAKACPSAVCVPDCTGKTCGDDGCGGTCGTCGAGTSCISNTCCTPSCDGKACGSDGCGGTCGTCAAGTNCNDSQGVCVASDACAGVPFGVGCCDGQTFKVCNSAYTLEAIDCTTTGGRCGWDSVAQGYACKTIGAPDPSNTHAWACAGGPVCVPDCTGKACGPDGCGGTCGSCPSGESCDNATGLCGTACGGIPPEGCCGGADGNTLTWCGKSGGSFADINTVDCGPAKDSCGWNTSVGQYLCSTDGTADPLGVYPKACPAIACVPDCAGKACGPDGCGGTCGTCGAGQACSATQLCAPTQQACGTVDWKGQCTGNTLEFCSPDGRLVTQNCAAVGSCGSNPSIGSGANSCIAANAATPAAPSGTCAGSCGTFAPTAGCQCDVDCAFRGDCCSDLGAECPFVGMADCAPSDACGNSNYLGTDEGEPPWRLPLTRTFENSGKPAGSRQYVGEPLDSVLPPPAPYPTDGLVAYVASPDVNAGHPGAHLVSDSNVADLVESAGGKLRTSLNFAAANGSPAKGASVVTLPEAISQRPHWEGQEPGGFSIATWVKAPGNASRTAPIPLLSAWGPTSVTRRVCASSRQDDATLTISCPTVGGVQSKVVSVHAYYGDVPDATGLPADTCAVADALSPSYRCHAPGFQTSARAACIGKSSCTLDAWKAAGDSDPCGLAPDPTIRSTAVVRAVCGPTSAGTGHVANLWMDGKSDTYTVRWDVPGKSPMRSTSPVRCDSPTCTGVDGKGWHHVAVTFHPFPGDTALGVTALYIDGDLQGTRSDLPGPRIHELSLGRGYVSTTSSTLPSAVDDSAPGNRAAAVALDEVFVFDRAISGPEVRSLMDKASQRTLRTWPPVGASEALGDGLWQVDNNASSAPISVGHILASDELEKPLTARHVAMAVTGSALNQRSSDPELANLTDFTLAAWIRVPGALNTLTDGALLTLFDSGVPIAGLTSGSGCANASVGGFIGAASLTASTDCSHGLASGRWAFVALWQKDGQQRVYVDGHLSASASSGAQTLLTGAASGETLLQTAAGVDLAWATLFDSALDLTALQTQRSLGPAVWLDGLTYNTFGSSDLRLRDFALFSNIGSATAQERRATLWKTDQAPATGNAAVGPITLGPSGWKAVTIPADGALAPEPGTAGPFGWSGRVTIPMADSIDLPLMARYRPDATGDDADFAARLKCSKAVDSAEHTCVVFAYGQTANGAQGFASPTWVSNFEGQSAMDLDIALSFDGTNARVALGSRTGSVTTAKKPAFGMQPGAYGSFLNTTVPDFVTFPQFRLQAGATDAQWHEIRLYPRRLGDVELDRLTLRTCASLGCAVSGQSCLKGGDAGLVTCGPCATSSEASSVAGGTCLKRKGFLAVCGHSEECETGLCHKGRCRAKPTIDKPQACVDVCDALGRRCVRRDGTTGKVFPSNSGGDIWDCTPTCRDFFDPPTSGLDTDQCIWNPTTGVDRYCTNDDQCFSGTCSREYKMVYRPDSQAQYPLDLVSKYGGCGGCYRIGYYFTHPDLCFVDPGYEGAQCHPFVWDAKTKYFDIDVCLPRDNDCKRLHRDKVVDKSSGKTTCSQNCTEQLLNGKQLWKKAFSVLSPKACQIIAYNAAVKSNAGLGVAQELLDKPVTLSELGTYLLNKPAGAPLLNSDIAKLRKLGVGRELIRYAAGRISSLKDEPRVWLGDCVRRYLETANGWIPVDIPGVPRMDDWDWRLLNGQNSIPYSGPPSAFFDPYKNVQQCVPETFPNGTQCPPKGVDAPEVDDDEWCDSGYCSRITGTCEDGGALWQDAQSAGRSDKKSGSNSSVSQIAIFKVIQQNQAGLTTGRVSKTPVTTGNNDRRFSVKAVNGIQLGMYDISFEALRSESEVEASSVANQEATNTSKQYIFGLGTPAVPSIGGLVSQYADPDCGNQWSGGSYDPNKECDMGVFASGKPLVPKFKLCVPIPDACANEDDEAPGVPLKGSPGPYSIKKKTCFRKQMIIGSVPVMLTVGPTLDICLEAGAVIDSDTFEPGFEIGPNFAFGADARAYPGTSFTESFFQFGLTANITLLGLGFPTVWGMRVRSQNKDADGKAAKDLFIVDYYRETSAKLTILALEIAAYMEFGISIFKVELKYPLIEFDGFGLSWSLQSDNLQSIHLDLLNVYSSY